MFPFFKSSILIKFLLFHKPIKN